jgi:hypothetical protein
MLVAAAVRLTPLVVLVVLVVVALARTQPLSLEQLTLAVVVVVLMEPRVLQGPVVRVLLFFLSQLQTILELQQAHQQLLHQVQIQF